MAFLFSTTKYSGNVTTSNWLATGHDGTDAMIIGGSGKLILSASNGIVHLSGALVVGLLPDNKNYHISTTGSYLILSSSVGSIIAISGSLFASGSTHTITGSLNLFDGIDERSVGAYHLRSVNNSLVLSSSNNSAVYISGNLQASGSHTLTGTLSLLDGISGSYYDARNITSNYHIRSVSSHLILSSSAGSVVRFSGAAGHIDLTTATLPAAATILSGAIVWDSTRKCLKVYSAEGWVAIATGSAA